jgi:hypothetical protein
MAGIWHAYLGRGAAVSELIQTTHEQQGPLPSHGNAVAVSLLSSKQTSKARSVWLLVLVVLLAATSSRGRGAVRRTGGGELGRDVAAAPVCGCGRLTTTRGRGLQPREHRRQLARFYWLCCRNKDNGTDDDINNGIPDLGFATRDRERERRKRWRSKLRQHRAWEARLVAEARAAWERKAKGEVEDGDEPYSFMGATCIFARRPSCKQSGINNMHTYSFMGILAILTLIIVLHYQILSDKR